MAWFAFEGIEGPEVPLGTAYYDLLMKSGSPLVGKTVVPGVKPWGTHSQLNGAEKIRDVLLTECRIRTGKGDPTGLIGLEPTARMGDRLHRSARGVTRHKRRVATMSVGAPLDDRTGVILKVCYAVPLAVDSSAQFLSLSFASLMRSCVSCTGAPACGLAFEARFPPGPSSLQLCYVGSLFFFTARGSPCRSRTDCRPMLCKPAISQSRTRQVSRALPSHLTV